MALGWFDVAPEAALKPGPRQLSIVVPTYHENDNITPLAERIFAGVCPINTHTASWNSGSCKFCAKVRAWTSGGSVLLMTHTIKTWSAILNA
jgi:hypothetical protein